MTYDPNMKRDPDGRPLDLRTTPELRTKSTWAPWAVIIAVVLVGAFVWTQMGGPTTDPTTTSSTTPPAATERAPAPMPMAPAAPPAATPAPAAPGNTTQP